MHVIARCLNRYRALSARNRRWAMVLALPLAIALLYALLQPAWSFSHRAKAEFEKEQALLDLMQQHAGTIRQLNAARQAKTGSDTSLLALASKTAGEHKLALQRYEPGADGKLSVWLSNADFNSVLAWLDQLTRQYNVRIERVSITATNSAGLVEAQLQLRE